MANHKSAQKRIRQTAKRRLANRYYKKSARTALRKMREKIEKEPEVATTDMPKVISMLDKLAGKKRVHKNKAANLKSKLMRALNKSKAKAEATPKAEAEA